MRILKGAPFSGGAGGGAPCKALKATHLSAATHLMGEFEVDGVFFHEEFDGGVRWDFAF